MARWCETAQRTARTGCALALAAAFAVATSVGASAQGETDPDAARRASASCLWVSLSTLEQARLELAALTGEGVPLTLLARLGPEGVANLIAECGFPPGDASEALVGRYWMSRAAAGIAEARLAQFGVPVEAARGAVAAAAPRDRIALFAEELMARVDGEAVIAVRGAIDALGLETPEQTGLFAEYAASLIIASGIEAGAAGPAAE